jgi:hypothetical protein
MVDEAWELQTIVVTDRPADHPVGRPDKNVLVGVIPSHALIGIEPFKDALCAVEREGGMPPQAKLASAVRSPDVCLTQSRDSHSSAFATQNALSACCTHPSFAAQQDLFGRSCPG